jgi:hypothetical protein
MSEEKTCQVDECTATRSESDLFDGAGICNNPRCKHPKAAHPRGDGIYITNIKIDYLAIIIYLSTDLHVYVCVCVFLSISLCIHLCMAIRRRIFFSDAARDRCMYVHLCLCLFMHLCMYVSMYVCMYVSM